MKIENWEAVDRAVNAVREAVAAEPEPSISDASDLSGYNFSLDPTKTALSFLVLGLVDPWERRIDEEALGEAMNGLESEKSSIIALSLLSRRVDRFLSDKARSLLIKHGEDAARTVGMRLDTNNPSAILHEFVSK